MQKSVKYKIIPMTLFISPSVIKYIRFSSISKFSDFSLGSRLFLYLVQNIDKIPAASPDALPDADVVPAFVSPFVSPAVAAVVASPNNSLILACVAIGIWKKFFILSFKTLLL